MKYSLIKRLYDMSMQDTTAKKLYATWVLEQPIFAKALSTVPYNYPHYSMHEESHSINIIEKIEKVLGDERILLLGPTDLWLILMVAYLHDMGMSISCELLENTWDNTEFQRYIEECLNSNDCDLKIAAEYILKLQSSFKLGAKISDQLNVAWPIKVRKYCTLLIAGFYRKWHAKMSANWIEENIHEKGLFSSLTEENIIPLRLLRLTGKIVTTHQMDFSAVMDLPFECDGMGTDVAHPRFVACMLRLGDLLDLDNGRFNIFWEKVTGGLPYSSDIHKKKHAAITHLFISPRIIEVEADCVTEAVYRETRSWIDWLKEELAKLASFWVEIVPKDFVGVPPMMKSVKLKLNGKDGSNEQIDLRFQISQDKAFEIIEGAGIYDNKLIFLREIIQNALDASKIQLWQDIKAEIYNGLSVDTVKYPTDIPSSVWCNYPICINVDFTRKGYVRVSVQDRGCGISKESLYSLANVGRSVRNKSVENILQSMPFWLQPTGAFGLGLQSIFLVSNEFLMDTKTASECSSKQIKFSSRKQTGYIIIKDIDDDMPRGTKLVVDIPFSKMNDMQLGCYPYDSFSCDENERVLFMIKNNVTNFLQEKTFDVKFSSPAYDEYSEQYEGKYKKFDCLKPIIIHDENFRYRIEKIEHGLLKIHVWENYLGSYLTFLPYPGWINPKLNIGSISKLAFRDIRVGNVSILTRSIQYGTLYLNLLKPSTKTVLDMSRGKISHKIENEIKEKLYKVIFPIIEKILLEDFNSSTLQEENTIVQWFSVLLLANVNGQTDLFNKFKGAFLKNSKTENLYFSSNEMMRFDETPVSIRELFLIKKVWHYEINKRSDKQLKAAAEKVTTSFDKSDVMLKTFSRLGHYITNNFLKIQLNDDEFYLGDIYELQDEKSINAEKNDTISIHVKDERRFGILRGLKASSIVRTIIIPLEPYGDCLAINKYPMNFSSGRISYGIISPFCKKNSEFVEKMQELIEHVLGNKDFNDEIQAKIRAMLVEVSEKFILKRLVEWISNIKQCDPKAVYDGYIDLMVEYYMKMIQKKREEKTNDKVQQ